ncbi:MAG: hypothetical protein E7044_11045 [Lentisphaerae bacterium]|nr:hypothetical protein [Lentisphaerota bacterium]
MKTVLLLLMVLLCGCYGTKPVKTNANDKYPVEKSFTAERKNASFQLAQKYINALNTSLETGDFSHIKKELPSKGTSPGARKIFENLKKRIASLGSRESCVYAGTLDCTLFVDHLWKYRFIKKTGDSRLPDQCYEVLYRIRVIYPDKSPRIIAADFLFR